MPTGCSIDYRRHPEVLRLAFWSQLEQPRRAASTGRHRGEPEKVARIRDAQQAGIVSSRFTPEHLLELIVRLSAIEGTVPPARGDKADALRKDLAEAVARIVAP